MRRIKSKFIMGMAREERKGEQGIVERELVQKRSGSFVNSPHTIRAMYLQLKRRFKFLSEFSRSIQELTGKIASKVLPPRVSKRIPVEQKPDRIAQVQKPLMLILEHCRPTLKKDEATGETFAIPHPTYRKARLAADRGDGAAVKQIAAQFA